MYTNATVIYVKFSVCSPSGRQMEWKCCKNENNNKTDSFKGFRVESIYLLIILYFNLTLCSSHFYWWYNIHFKRAICLRFSLSKSLHSFIKQRCLYQFISLAPFHYIHYIIITFLHTTVLHYSISYQKIHVFFLPLCFHSVCFKGNCVIVRCLWVNCEGY